MKGPYKSYNEFLFIGPRIPIEQWKILIKWEIKWRSRTYKNRMLIKKWIIYVFAKKEGVASSFP